MKILHFGKFYPPCFGGIERVILEIVEALNDHHIQADVLCANTILKTTHETKHTKHQNPYKIHRCASFGKVASTAIAPSMLWHLKALCGDYDIIHTHHPDPLSALMLYLVRPKAKIILHWHSDIIHQKHLLKLYHPLLLWLINRADKIIGATPSHIKDSDYTPFFKDKTAVIPYAISPLTGELKPTPFSKHHFNIFSLGRLVYYKGYEYLIDSALHLDEHFRIYIGGEGVLKEKLSAQIKQKHLEHRVFLLNALPHEDLYSYYQNCDVFVLPSVFRSEMFGIVQIEAMACHKPVIATQIPRSGISFVHDTYNSGLLIPPRDPLALAQAFIKLQSDTQLYQTLCQNAYKRSQDFLPETIIPAFIDLYRSLL